MKILIAVKGTEGELFFRRAATLAPLTTAEEVLLAHVIDAGPRADLEVGRERFLTRRPLSPERGADLLRAEEERAGSALQFARQALVVVGVSEDRIREITLRGKPNEELRRLAEGERVDLVLVQGRSGKPGPYSVGKTARFLIDHAPRSALLVR
jgi:nucleotide-binding universal stress UspA family protein